MDGIHSGQWGFITKTWRRAFRSQPSLAPASWFQKVYCEAFTSPRHMK